MLATFVTFLIAGLWHGSSWMFVVFGGLHGIALVINNYWKKQRFHLNKLLSWFITFNFVNIAFIFFRAKEWSDATKVLGSMFSLNNIVLPNILERRLEFLTDFGINYGGFVENIKGDLSVPIWILFGFIVVLMFKNSVEIKNSLQLNYKSLIFTTMIFLFSTLSMNKVSEFIYFNF
jgi:hypothetical protein